MTSCRTFIDIWQCFYTHVCLKWDYLTHITHSYPQWLLFSLKERYGQMLLAIILLKGSKDYISKCTPITHIELITAYNQRWPGSGRILTLLSGFTRTSWPHALSSECSNQCQDIQSLYSDLSKKERLQVLEPARNGSFPQNSWE